MMAEPAAPALSALGGGGGAEGMLPQGNAPFPSTTSPSVPAMSVPHAFHQNLPRPFHFYEAEAEAEAEGDNVEGGGGAKTTTAAAAAAAAAAGLPYVTRLAHAKARRVVELARSLRLTPDMLRGTARGRPGEDDGDEEGDEDEEAGRFDDGEEGDGHPPSPPVDPSGTSSEPEDLDVEDGEDDDDDDDDIEGIEGIDGGNPPPGASPAPAPARRHRPDTLQGLTKRLSRLQSQLSGLESLKYGGISQAEMCEIVLLLLRLLTCTVERRRRTRAGGGASSSSSSPPDDDAPMEDSGTARGGAQPAADDEEEEEDAVLHFDSVGYLWQGADRPMAHEDDADPAALRRPFALHSPAREVVLLVLLNIVSNKGPLRSASNASVYPAGAGRARGPEEEPPRSLLILNWRALMRCLLRTAPYLDEHRSGHVTSDSHYRQSNVLRRTVQLVRDGRHFFDQGVRPPDAAPTAVEPDAAAKQVWDVVRDDVLYHSHTHACYRATVLLYLFHPTRCSPAYYAAMMPVWVEAWTHIDRCPEYDFLYLALFCRARKHLGAAYDWGPVRRRLLTLAQYWLFLPIGGASLDKSFPQAANPRGRSCPSRLKVFTGGSTSYEEGIDFVAKVVKLLVAGVGADPPGGGAAGGGGPGPGAPLLSEGTRDMLRFLRFATPYFNPSNIGSWTFTLGAFLHYFAYELCCRVGEAAGMRSLRRSHPGVADAMEASQPGAAREIPPRELVALMDVLLPLCQQAIYSKNPHVGRAGEAALLYLVQIDPARATPGFIDFAARALDVTSVTMAHQAPSALSALTRLIQPALRADPGILLQRLPAILNLSLKGIDSNDQNKTIRTLILYRSLTSWLPVGGRPETWKCIELKDEREDLQHDDEYAATADGTRRVGHELFNTIASMRDCPEYRDAVARLPSSSLLRAGESGDSSADREMQRLYLDEAVSAMSDWAIEFLERIFGLLRASGEREKTAKSSSREANRHSNADVHQARNFSRVFQECAVQLFASMDGDVHAVATRALVRFLEEESHPSASKDASLLCQAAAAARTESSSPGLDALIPVLAEDCHHHSTKTSIYRVRCLAGAVRYAGKAVVAHRAAISKTLDYALASDDRHLFKTGCKLLRHLLCTLCESYPLASDSAPRVYRDSQRGLLLGRSGQLRGDPVQWHVPDQECIRFACDLLAAHVSSRLSALCSSEDGPDGKSRLLNSGDVVQLRRCLRIVRYSIRGGASALLDEGLDKSSDDIVAYEMACFRLIEIAGQESKEQLLQLRGWMCNFLLVLASIVTSDTFHPEGHESLPEDEPSRKAIALISSDPKVCKETCDLALLLLTRRGAAFRSQEARTIWVAQKQVAADFSLSAQVDYMAETLQNAAKYGDCTTLLYKDGEDAGKSIPRRLLVTRVQLFHASMQRTASIEVPRRMRRVEREMRRSRNVLFNVQPSVPESVTYLEALLKGGKNLPLDAYEGIVDGLFALCCHSNTQVRASAITVVNYAMTRFGWIVASRVPRLLSGLSLKDESMNGKFGLPSCAALVEKMNQQGRRKRLAEAIKGVCSILSMTRAVRQMLGSWKMRHRFVETLCGTDHLVSLLPAEEMQKTIHYLQSLFSAFRSSFYNKPRSSWQEREFHEKSIRLVLAILSEKKSESNVEDLDSNDSKRGAHWRKLLIASWFLLVFVDGEDVQSSPVKSEVWTTCFYLLETNAAQPLQRVALGLFGKLLCFVNPSSVLPELKAKMETESFCRVLTKALVYDHREDTSFGGGHDAQWSSGVETIIRDAGRLIAPRTLFPFQRTGQSLGAFKVAHSQFVEQLLLTLDEATAMRAAKCLLSEGKELTAAPPSEDQRNQQITAAEIFAGVCGSLIRSPRTSAQIWSSLLLPSLEDGMTKTPFSLCGSYFDAVRYSLQYAPPDAFYPLTQWLTEKIKSTLWQPNGAAADVQPASNAPSQNGSPAQATEAGFTTQSKWLYLFSAVLIEMDVTESDDIYIKPARFIQNFTAAAFTPEDPMDVSSPAESGEFDRKGSLETSWRLVTESLLPVLTEAIGHPFDSCRDHISRCLFRICYSHRKFARVAAASLSRAPSRSSSGVDLSAMLISEDPGIVDPHDPGWKIVARLSSLLEQDPPAGNSSASSKDRMNSLISARRFISNCVHMGEAKFEFSDYVVPLLPLAFGSLDLSSDDPGDGGAGAGVADSARTALAANAPSAGADDRNKDAGSRALEAEVIKGFRGMISDVSVTAVISYGGRAAEADVVRVLDAVEGACRHAKWQVRHAGANYLRCFQGAHKFLLASESTDRATALVTDLLADDRREVSSAAMAALTGILAAAPLEDVARMVRHYAKVASASKMRRSRGRKDTVQSSADVEKESRRARDQQVSVFFLSAAVLSCPYDTPPHVPVALAAISPHSFERTAPLGVRETVKRCCAEYKRTHMSDNWDEHRRAFSTEQLEAFEDVVSTPHYYA